MAKWPASALPVADAVSLYFTVSTSQHSMWQTAPLMHLVAFYDQFAVVKFRRIDGFMRGQVSEKWDTNGCWRLPPQLAETARQTSLMEHFYSWCSHQLRQSCQRDAATDRDSPSVTSPWYYQCAWWKQFDMYERYRRKGGGNDRWRIFTQ